MSSAVKAALEKWSARMMRDLGQEVSIDGEPALARFSCDEDEIKVSLGTKVDVGSEVKRGEDVFQVTAVVDGVMKRAMIRRR